MRIIGCIIMIIFNCFNILGQGQIKRSDKNSRKTEKTITFPLFISSPDDYVNGHGYVDLGLPSGIKWATNNINAKYPQQIGDLFSWGENRAKKEYTWENYFDYSGNNHKDSFGGIIYEFNKFNPTNSSECRITPDSGYDTAREIWGSTWRMPTVLEMEELINSCIWEIISQNEIQGYKVTGPNKKSIFIPFDDLIGIPRFFIWSNTLNGPEVKYHTGDSNAYGMFGLGNGEKSIRPSVRYVGKPIRPVTN